MHNVRAYTFWFLQFYISAYTTLNELLVVFLYIIFAVLLKFERSLNSYFVHNNNNYYYLPATSLQNFIYLRQSAAEILLFVQKSKMADFFCSIFWHFCMYDLQRNTQAKFRANMCNSKQVMNERWNSKWRQPPSWIYYFCLFWSKMFPAAAGYITAKFYLSTSIGGRDIAVCTRRHLGFIFCSIFWHTCM